MKFDKRSVANGNVCKIQRNIEPLGFNTVETDKYKAQSEDQNWNIRLCREYVALDLVPLTTVEGRGF